jgi:hypothetical protein
MPKSGIRPALMVYYKGSPGWLDKKVAWEADAESDPVFADFQRTFVCSFNSGRPRSW